MNKPTYAELENQIAELIRQNKKLSLNLAIQNNEKEQQHNNLDAYYGILNTTLDGFWIAGSKGKMLDVNQRYVIQSGYSHEELLNMSISDLEAKENVDDVQAHLTRIIDANGQIFETAHRRKDGSIWQVEVIATYLNDKFFVFLRDITERKELELKDQALIQRNQMLMDNALEGIHILDAKGNVLEANRAFCQYLGYSPEEVLHLNVTDWEAKITGDELQNLLNNMLNGQATFETRHRRKDGKIIDVEVNAVGVMLDGHQCLYASSKDISKRKQVEQKLLESENKFRQLIEKLPIPLVLANNDETLNFINTRFETLLGYNLEDIPTLKEWWLLAYPDENYRAWVLTTWTAAVEKAFAENCDIEPIEYEVTCKDGSVRVMIISGIPLDDCFLATLIDITERKTAEEIIKQLAFYDPLTKLPNRRLLHERLKHGIEISQRMDCQLAVLMLDLDKFKAVNDTLGHSAGDDLLQQVAQRIKVHLREMDTVARLGGDEFVVLIENVTEYEQIVCVANNIIDTLKQPFILSMGHEANIGTSIGIALYPQDGENIETLMDNADSALYHAKDNGRGCFAYFSVP